MSIPTQTIAGYNNIATRTKLPNKTEDKYQPVMVATPALAKQSIVDTGTNKNPVIDSRKYGIPVNARMALAILTRKEDLVGEGEKAIKKWNGSGVKKDSKGNIIGDANNHMQKVNNLSKMIEYQPISDVFRALIQKHEKALIDSMLVSKGRTKAGSTEEPKK